MYIFENLQSILHNLGKNVWKVNYIINIYIYIYEKYDYIFKFTYIMVW
jgi:hypothetical protein